MHFSSFRFFFLCGCSGTKYALCQMDARGTGVLAPNGCMIVHKKSTILQCRDRPSWVLKIMENLWAVGVPPRTPLGSSQRAHRPLSWWGGGCCPLPITPPPVSAFVPSVLPPMKNPAGARPWNLYSTSESQTCSMNVIYSSRLPIKTHVEFIKRTAKFSRHKHNGWSEQRSEFRTKCMYIWDVYNNQDSSWGRD